MFSTVSSVPWRGRRHARGHREELLGELLGGPAGRVGQLVRDLVQAVVHQPLDLAVRERGCPERVGQQAQRLGQARGRHFEGEPYAGVVGVRVEGGAAALQLGGELLGGVLVGALGEGPRHDRGDAVQVGRLGLQGRVQEHFHGDDLLAGAVAAQDRQAVVERAALGGREGPGPGVAGLRLGVEFHRGELGHWAASSFSSWSAGVSGAMRFVDEHRAVVGAQAGLGDFLDLLGAHVEHALYGGQGELRVAEQDRVAAQFVGAARDGAEPVQPLALQLGLGALHLLGAWGPPRRTGRAPRRWRPR